MYRQGYSEQPGMNPNMGGYDFRSSSLHYKPPPQMDNMTNMSSMPGMGAMQNMNQNYMQPHQMYYDGQPGAQSMQQNQYMPMMPVQNMEPNYDMSRFYWREMEQKHPEGGYSMTQPSHNAPQYVSPPPQLNVVQRIAGLIKSQLPGLQAIMAQVSLVYSQPQPRSSVVESRRQHSRSRSRSKQRYRKGSDSSHDWLCRKCSFSNYDWRDSCKKCTEPRPSRSFVPGPEDWKCPKCGNINYARRMECNRCKRPKTEKD